MHNYKICLITYYYLPVRLQSYPDDDRKSDRNKFVINVMKHILVSLYKFK